MGEYKSVQVPFTDTQFPPQIKENMMGLFGSINDQIVDGIARGRRALLAKFDGFSNAELESNPTENGVEESRRLEQETLMYDAALDANGTKTSEALVKATVPNGTSSNASNKLSVDTLSHHSNLITITPSSTEIDKVKHIMDVAPLSAEEAKTAGLINSIDYKRELYEHFWPWTSPYNRSLRKPSSTNAMTFQRYAAAATEEKAKQAKRSGSGNTILGTLSSDIAARPVLGLVYVIGLIRRGDSQFGSHTIVKAITEAARDTEVKAIVLRIGERDYAG